MSDYLKLKDIFEMAEVLSDEKPNALYIDTVESTTGNSIELAFLFNENMELEEVQAQLS